MLGDIEGLDDKDKEGLTDGDMDAEGETDGDID